MTLNIEYKIRTHKANLDRWDKGTMMMTMINKPCNAYMSKFMACTFAAILNVPEKASGCNWYVFWFTLCIVLFECTKADLV